MNKINNIKYNNIFLIAIWKANIIYLNNLNYYKNNFKFLFFINNIKIKLNKKNIWNLLF